MANLQLRWHANNGITKKTSEEQSRSNPLVPYILTQKKIGTPKKVVMEKLMNRGYQYRSIKRAYALIDKMDKSRLDWRSPTAINETARMIRRDIRARKISYSMGMKIIISARDNLRTLIPNRRDKRIAQLNQELRTTKNLLMNSFADPRMVQQFKVAGS
jgi:hypothetical protein